MKKFLCLLLIIILIQTFGFTSICDEEGLVGDLNEDGIVNSIDATILKRFLLEVIDNIPVKNLLWSADTNGDGIINSNDYVILTRYILNVIDKFPKKFLNLLM